MPGAYSSRPGAGHGSRRAQPGDEVGQAAVRLREQFRAGGAEMRFPVRRMAVLVGVITVAVVAADAIPGVADPVQLSSLAVVSVMLEVVVLRQVGGVEAGSLIQVVGALEGRQAPVGALAVLQPVRSRLDRGADRGRG